MSTESNHQPDSGHSVALRAERRWAIFAVGLIVLMLAVIVFSGLHWAMMPPSRVETIDPSRLQLSGEFVEDNLGSAVQPDGSVIVRFIAQQYSFTPQCIVVPADMPVTFRATATDTIHGFVVGKTNANTMLVPGFVSTFTTTFQQPGEQLMPCHEYCGTGHEAMWARVQVLSASDFLAKSRTGERLSCVARP